MFSLLLSFIIDLYSFILLTPSVKIAGINNKFCKKIASRQNHIPFAVPSVNVKADIVYPNITPLKSITANTIGTPITVVPAIQIIRANIMLFFIEDIINCDLSILSIVLYLFIKSFIYVISNYLKNVNSFFTFF